MKNKQEYFSSRWALLLATVGMAIGAGNIWRFPRLAGQYGGSFLIPWFIFLFLWSIPLILIEFSLGKTTRKGVIGSFASLISSRFTWMGGFVAVCTMAIMFYYSVVTGWAFRYFLVSITGQLYNVNHQLFWQQFTNGFQPLWFHFLALAVGSFIIYQGIVAGIERANKILLPSLLLLLMVAAVRALTLPNSLIGLNYFFNIKIEQLLNYQIWLEGLSQSAWSTGAGWGLITTYAVYMRKREGVVLNSFITGFGNNSASLLAGLAIIPAIFSLAPSIEQAEAALKIGNDGLAFIVIPQLFSKIPGSIFFTSIFFLALFFAALSSLISMLELSTRIVMDFGLPRRKALPLVSLVCALLGMPSAIYFKMFQNQDWVWGLGLIISGLFFAILIINFNVTRFRSIYVNLKNNDIYVGKWFDYIVKYLIPIEAFILLLWWLYQAVEWNPKNWFNPFKVDSVGTCILQWSGVILLLLLFNKRTYRQLFRTGDFNGN
jgi:NSS family neurotransmitter:Na+ symporter